MRKLKLLVENYSTEAEIMDFLKSELLLRKFKINPDLTVDVFEEVDFTGTKLDSLPIQFNIVHGNFLCHEVGLITLKGCPKLVKGDFDCSYNKLTDLIGAPKTINGYFYCNSNNLKTLTGSPKYVQGDYKCTDNKKYFEEEYILSLTKVGDEIITGWS